MQKNASLGETRPEAITLLECTIEGKKHPKLTQRVHSGGKSKTTRGEVVLPSKKRSK